MTQASFDDLPLTDLITIEAKGNYAELTITRDDAVWRLLLDEKNLSKFLFTARKVLNVIRGEPGDTL